MDLTRITFSLNSLYLFWPTSGLKVSTNELTSWIECVRWGRLKCDSYHTCLHSFKAALIAFLVTSWLNWPRHCMHVVSFVLSYEMIQTTAHAGTRYEPSTVSALIWLAPCTEVKLERASESSPVWCGHKDVLRLNKCTSYQEKKWQKQQLWMGWPTLAPPLR